MPMDNNPATIRDDDHQQQQENHCYEVQLAIYDLSRGMARQLSSQFLGVVLDAIPHTGLIVYGREWYYGGGIQNEHPQQFRAHSGLVPMQILALGRTRVTPSQFEAWCRYHGPTTYNERTYDLLRHNCNHFSRDAIVHGLGLSESLFPEWILQVPIRFLESPMGQLVRPMLENMQLSAPPVRGNANSIDNRNTASSLSISQDKLVNTDNPWAKRAATPTLAPTDSPCTIKATPTLDSLDQPLYSNDTQMVDACIQKLKVVVDANAKLLLEQTAPILRSQQLDSSDSSKSTATTAVLSDTLAKQLLDVLINLPQQNNLSSSLFTCVFLLLRLVVLKCPHNSTVPKDCVQKLLQMFPLQGEDSTMSPSSKALILLTISNAIPKFSHSDDMNSDDEFWNACIETATIMLSRDQTVAVRQVASAVLYNVTYMQIINMESTPQHNNRKDQDASGDVVLSDTIVSILCAVVGFIPDETDPTTLLRLFMVLGRLFLPSKKNHSSDAAVQVNCVSDKSNLDAAHPRAAIMTLAKDLGLVDTLNSLGNIPVHGARNNDAEMCRKIMAELAGLLSSI